MQPTNYYSIWGGTVSIWISFVSFYKNQIRTNLFASAKNSLEGATVAVICADSITFPTGPNRGGKAG